MEHFKLFGNFLTHGDKKNVMLNWIFSSDNTFFEEFVIEKSTDNKEFKIIGTEQKILPVKRAFHYLFIDENIDSENNYYRVFLKKRNSGRYHRTTSISNTITIKTSGDNNFKNTDTKTKQNKFDLILQ